MGGFFNCIFTALKALAGRFWVLSVSDSDGAISTMFGYINSCRNSLKYLPRAHEQPSPRNIRARTLPCEPWSVHRTLAIAIQTHTCTDV
jgi:hypothetical protein